jgi:hypothetical protein
VKVLLDGKFAPITHTIGFIRCDRDVVADAYLKWQRPIQGERGVTLSSRPVSGSLEDVLHSLLPLTSVEARRFLFLPTRSEWTAFLDNDQQGTDVISTLAFLAQHLSCEALRATHVPEEGGGRLGATVLELYAAEEREFLNYRRSVAVGFDGRKWTFSAAGEVQPYETVARYEARSVKDRFTRDMLADYLRALNIHAFDAGYYLPQGTTATLVEKHGPTAPGAKEFWLAEGLAARKA